ncbi:hypothetical protein ABZ070_34550 [Streptomyces sp. NPDC006283]|uniref:hypothetical protein n=1 Tax=Streptomyces sp. NPDC006283 TaxID=3156741 RepID=UPI0033AC1EC0
MSFFSGVEDLELFLSRSRVMTVVSVPVCVGAMVFFLREEGWRFSMLLCCVLPLIAAYLGIRGKREIRIGLAAAGLALAVVTLPLALVLSRLEGA